MNALVIVVSLVASADRYWEQRNPQTDSRDIETLAPEALPSVKPQGAKAEGAKAEGEKPGRKDLVKADPDKKMVGIGMEAGGGVGGFTDSRISNVTSAQGQWTARMVFGTRSHFGGETAYVGSAQTVNTLGIQPGATIVGNGAQGGFRFNVLTGMFQPYAMAGIGWTHYTLGNAQLTTSDVSLNGDVATFPLATGMAWRFDGLVLDSRVTFTPATSSGLVRGTNLSTWAVQGHAGFEF
jgi:hypothetical protein